MKLICLRKTTTPIISVQIWYKTGSVNERDGIRGISHFLEHMMFRGSKNVKSEEHAKRINNTGGHSNAFTAEDVTAFTNSVPRDYLDMVLELEADRMGNLTIDAALFETERKVIVEEFQTYMNNPVAKAFLEFRREFYKDYPYAMSPLGLLEDLRKFSAADCCDYYKEWYRPDNAVVVIVGDFESDQQVFEKVKSYFGPICPERLARKKAAASVPMELDSLVPHTMKRRVDFDVPLLVIGYPGPPSSHEDAMALEILQLVLSGGETGRLHREVVRKQSVAVMAGGMNHFLRHSGMSMFFAAFTPDISPKKVEAALEGEIEKIKNGGITAQEIEKVRNATLTSRTFELYSSENICHRIGFSETIEGNYRLWVERLEALRRLDTTTLLAVARKYWDDLHSHVLYLQPKKVNPMLYVAGFFRRLVRK